MKRIIIGLLLISLLLLVLLLVNKTIEMYSNIGEKTIWAYWDQGADNISVLYKLCIETWKRHNPYHNIIIVDKNSIWKYLDKEDLPPNWEKITTLQLKSDFVRLALLVKYGGIWMDISTICIKPINSVFKQEKSIEGFAIRKFDNNNGISVFENWFISGKKNSKVIKKWRDEFLKIFGNSTSTEEMNKDPFKNVNLQKINHGWYLTMHRVMMKLNQLDDEVKYLYYNDSNIFGAEETAFLHYSYFKNMDKLLEQDDIFFKKVIDSGTPILKFTGNGGILKDMDETQLLSNKNSVIYKLLTL